MCFFPSYDYERKVHTHWSKTGVLERITRKKKVSHHLSFHSPSLITQSPPSSLVSSLITQSSPSSLVSSLITQSSPSSLVSSLIFFLITQSPPCFAGVQRTKISLTS